MDAHPKIHLVREVMLEITFPSHVTKRTWRQPGRTIYEATTSVEVPEFFCRRHGLAVTWHFWLQSPMRITMSAPLFDRCFAKPPDLQILCISPGHTLPVPFAVYDGMATATILLNEAMHLDQRSTMVLIVEESR